MFAIIKTGGKQYKVKKDDILTLEKLPQKEGAEIAFDQVLLISNGQNLELGKPYLKGVKVGAKILKQGKAEKINVMKFKNKVRYRRKRGHRQLISQVKILSIGK
ncbi:MAG: 50S ribosomal protein L21 [Patescibacteria group bacterium]